MDARSIQLSFANHLEYSLSKDQYTATIRDLYHSLALGTRDRLIERWIRTQQMYYDHDVKRVYYLSAEYLMGRALIKQVRIELLEKGRMLLETLVRDITGRRVTSLHTDISTVTGERVIIFALDGPLDVESASAS